MYRNDYWSLLWSQNCDIPICFGTPECWVKVDRQTATKSRQKCAFYSVKTEIIGQKLTKFVHDIAKLLPFSPFKASSRSSNPLSAKDILGYLTWYTDFCRMAIKVDIFSSINSGVTGPDLTTFICNSEKFMLFNFWKSELRYCSLFQNASSTNEVCRKFCTIFHPKLVAMATSLEGSQSDMPS